MVACEAQVHHNVASRSVTISAVSCTGAAVVLDPAILDFVKAQVLAQLGAEGVESVVRTGVGRDRVVV